MVCKNCNNEFEGNYCNNCGQRSVKDRITLKEIISDFFQSFTHVDKGIIFLIKDLFIRPDKVSKEYIAGRRKKYFSPFKYLIFTVTLSAFITLKFSSYELTGINIITENISKYQHFMNSFAVFMYKYLNILLFFIIPVSSFFSYLIYKKSGYNYAENLIFNSYIAGQRYIIYLIFSPLLFIPGKEWHFEEIYLIFWNIYFIYSFQRFFGGKIALNIVKYILVLLLSFVIIQGLSMGVFALFFYK
ncbi:MAG TPA: DUF3667 domain-containing protein [Ignavibacteria bacterium]|nr:DUF3667 domain-containing protein [Ignavibacteria bacterium]